MPSWHRYPTIRLIQLHINSMYQQTTTTLSPGAAAKSHTQHKQPTQALLSTNSGCVSHKCMRHQLAGYQLLDTLIDGHVNQPATLTDSINHLVALRGLIHTTTTHPQLPTQPPLLTRLLAIITTPGAVALQPRWGSPCQHAALACCCLPWPRLVPPSRPTEQPTHQTKILMCCVQCFTARRMPHRQWVQTDTLTAPPLTHRQDSLLTTDWQEGVPYWVTRNKGHGAGGGGTAPHARSAASAAWLPC